MANTILSGDFTVYYDGDTGGDLQIRWTGAVNNTTTRTVNELYSALQDLIDNSSQMDEGVPMSAQTPTAYTIGRIETNDADGWFIDPVSIQHLTGGAITTTGWSRVEGTDRGIVKVPYTAANNFVDSDLGKVVTNASTSCSGRLLYYDNTAGEAWIRPTDATSTHNWSGSTGQLNVTSGTTNAGSQTANRRTGERLWSNIFTIGTLSNYSRIYVAQNETVIDNFWDDGDPTSNHIDRLFLISDGFDTTWGGLIDDGYLTVYARQNTELYDHFVTDVSGGGRTAVPLSTQADLNNTTGYRTLSLSAGTTGAFSVGATMRGLSSGAWGIVTEVVDSTTLEYYLVKDVSVDFQASESLEAPDSSTVTIDGTGPTNTSFANGGPANANGITVSYTLHGYQDDVDGDTTNEEYSIQIDVNNNTLAFLYEHLKYLTRRGSTTSFNGVQGQQYVGVDYRIDFATDTALATLGEQVTGSVSGATGIIVKEDGSGSDATYVMLMNSQGTFVTGENLLGPDGSTIYYTSTTAVESIPPSKQSPFGTFAGGRFFGARSVHLTNVLAGEVNDYELIDDGGTTRTEPIQVTFSFTGLETDSEVRIYDASADVEVDTLITSTTSSGDESTTSIVTAVDIANAGSGYSVSDVLEITGGTATNNAELTVDSVDGSGAITGVSISDGGTDYSVNPTNPASHLANGVGNSVTTGSGATFVLTLKGQHDYTYTYPGSPTSVYAVIFHLNFKDIRLTGLTLTNSGQSIPIQQTIDRVFSNPA